LRVQANLDDLVFYKINCIVLFYHPVTEATGVKEVAKEQ